MPPHAPSRQNEIREEEERILARFGGRRHLMLNVIDVFLSSYPDTMQVLEKAAEERDAEGVEEAAHKLKGAICNLSWDTSYDTAQALEQMGRERKWKDVDETLALLKTEIARFDRTLKAIGAS